MRSVSENSWAGFEFEIGGNNITGASLGLFESLFGTEDNHALVIWAAQGAAGLSEDNDLDQEEWSSLSPFHLFRSNGSIDSEAIAIGASGTLIDASLPSALAAVPEASEVALVLLGAGGLLANRRRRRRSA